MLVLRSPRRFGRLLQFLLSGQHAFAHLGPRVHVVNRIIMRSASQSLQPRPWLLLPFPQERGFRPSKTRLFLPGNLSHFLLLALVGTRPGFEPGGFATRASALGFARPGLAIDGLSAGRPRRNLVEHIHVRHRNIILSLFLLLDVLVGGHDIQRVQVLLFEQILELREDVETLVLAADDVGLLAQDVLLPQRFGSVWLLVVVGHDAVGLSLALDHGRHFLLGHLVLGEVVSTAAVENADGLLGNGVCVVFDWGV